MSNRVYFRPFNFVADNDLSRSHMVQYISHPQNTWSRSREEHTDEYENPLPHPPDPEELFQARLVVSKPEIRVYVGDDTEPCLVVSELTDRTGGSVGLWMGSGSDGSFAELLALGESPERNVALGAQNAAAVGGTRQQA